MPIEYTWKIQSVKVLPDLSNRNNIVKTIEFMLEGSRDENTNFVLGSVELSVDLESETFIPFDELTEETVVEWVKNALGSERINQYVYTIEQRFGPEELIETPLPWVPVETELEEDPSETEQ